MVESSVVTIPYSEELLLAFRQEPETFEREARLFLAVKLYELGKSSTGMVAQLAGVTRVALCLSLHAMAFHPLVLMLTSLPRTLRIRLIFSNTTPLIALASINQVDVFNHLYGEIVIPPAVEAELAAGSGRIVVGNKAWTKTVALLQADRSSVRIS